MSSASILQPISVLDYLSDETRATRKHEYVNGNVYAMAGGTNAHNRIATNATVAIGGQLRGNPCGVINSDTKIRIQTDRRTYFYYPDVSVICESNPASDTFQDEPVVLIEVVSQSTRRADEIEKREAYLSIESLRVYILAEQSTAAAVVWRRTDDGFVREAFVGLESIIPLAEINCELPLAELYEGVEFLPEVIDEA